MPSILRLAVGVPSGREIEALGCKDWALTDGDDQGPLIPSAAQLSRVSLPNAFSA